MKRIAARVTVLSGIVLAGAASATAGVQRVGGVLDVNFATVSTDDPEAKGFTGTTVRLGIGGVVEYGINEKLSLVAEPMFLGKGTSVDTTEVPGGTTAKAKLSYFEIPVFAKYAFGGSDGIQPYLLAGPTIGFKTGAKAVIDTGEDASTTTDISEDTAGMDFGVALGGGVSKPFGSARVFAEAQYVLGLKDIEKDIEGAEAVTTKNRGFQLRVGVTFQIGSKEAPMAPRGRRPPRR